MDGSFINVLSKLGCSLGIGKYHKFALAYEQEINAIKGKYIM